MYRHKITNEIVFATEKAFRDWIEDFYRYAERNLREQSGGGGWYERPADADERVLRILNIQLGE